MNKETSATVVAIEGLCFAGKSTLAGLLSSRLPSETLAVLPDYSDMADARDRPMVPARGPAEELAALDYYLSLDLLRWSAVSDATQIVIQDRSVHTLLAHIYSNEFEFGFNVLRKASHRMVAIPKERQPDFVIYLDVSEAILVERYRTIPNQIAEVLKSHNYMRGFRHYFMTLSVSRRHFVLLDADRTPEAIADDVVNFLRQNSVC